MAELQARIEASSKELAGLEEEQKEDVDVSTSSIEDSIEAIVEAKSNSKEKKSKKESISFL